MHITVLMFAAHTWGYAYFRFDKWPTWAPSPEELLATTVDPNAQQTICYVVNSTTAAVAATTVV